MGVIYGTVCFPACLLMLFQLAAIGQFFGVTRTKSLNQKIFCHRCLLLYVRIHVNNCKYALNQSER